MAGDPFPINSLKFNNIKELNFIDPKYAKFLSIDETNQMLGFVKPSAFINNAFVAGDRVKIKPVIISGLTKYEISADYNSSDEVYLSRIAGQLQRMADSTKTTIFN